MKYLKTKHQKNSAKITTIIVVILILLCFVIGQDYQDPPEEYGVAINFGNSATGSGDVQPNKPVKSEDLKINKQPQNAQSEPIKNDDAKEASATEKVKEDLLTQDSEDAIAIKKAEADKKVKLIAQEKALAEAKLEADKKAKVEADAKKKAKEAKKKAEIDAIMGGINNSDGQSSGSEGNDNEPGDKGQLDGKPYAPSYFGEGEGNGGLGYGLNGRGKPTKTKVIPECQEEGRVVVEIHVNKEGKVIHAIPGIKGTTGDACLFEAAKKTALSHKWEADSNAPFKQFGYVIIDFRVGQ